MNALIRWQPPRRRRANPATALLAALAILKALAVLIAALALSHHF